MTTKTTDAEAFHYARTRDALTQLVRVLSDISDERVLKLALHLTFRVLIQIADEVLSEEEQDAVDRLAETVDGRMVTLRARHVNKANKKGGA